MATPSAGSGAGSGVAVFFSVFRPQVNALEMTFLNILSKVAAHHSYSLSWYPVYNLHDGGSIVLCVTSLLFIFLTMI